MDGANEIRLSETIRKKKTTSKELKKGKNSVCVCVCCVEGTNKKKIRKRFFENWNTYLLSQMVFFVSTLLILIAKELDFFYSFKDFFSINFQLYCYFIFQLRIQCQNRNWKLDKKKWKEKKDVNDNLISIEWRNIFSFLLHSVYLIELSPVSMYVDVRCCHIQRWRCPDISLCVCVYLIPNRNHLIHGQHTCCLIQDYYSVFCIHKLLSMIRKSMNLNRWTLRREQGTQSFGYSIEFLRFHWNCRTWGSGASRAIDRKFWNFVMPLIDPRGWFWISMVQYSWSFG